MSWSRKTLLFMAVALLAIFLGAPRPALAADPPLSNLTTLYNALNGNPTAIASLNADLGNLYGPGTPTDINLYNALVSQYLPTFTPGGATAGDWAAALAAAKAEVQAAASGNATALNNLNAKIGNTAGITYQAWSATYNIWMPQVLTLPTNVERNLNLVLFFPTAPTTPTSNLQTLYDALGGNVAARTQIQADLGGATVYNNIVTALIHNYYGYIVGSGNPLYYNNACYLNLTNDSLYLDPGYRCGGTTAQPNDTTALNKARSDILAAMNGDINALSRIQQAIGGTDTLYYPVRSCAWYNSAWRCWARQAYSIPSAAITRNLNFILSGYNTLLKAPLVGNVAVNTVSLATQYYACRFAGTCTSNADCSGGSCVGKCDSCTSDPFIGGACTDDTDCTAPETCDTSSNTCVACKVNADCGAGKTCATGVCVACPGGSLTCSSDAACGVGGTCLKACKYTTCTSNQQTLAAMTAAMNVLYWVIGGGECVPCCACNLCGMNGSASQCGPLSVSRNNPNESCLSTTEPICLRAQSFMSAIIGDWGGGNDAATRTLITNAEANSAAAIRTILTFTAAPNLQWIRSGYGITDQNALYFIERLSLGFPIPPDAPPPGPGCVDNSGCTAGQVCLSGTCVAPITGGACQTATCSGTDVCTGGACIPAAAATCTTVSCSGTDTCTNGVCVPASAPACPAAPGACAPGTSCIGGKCVSNSAATCGSNMCPAGQVCLSNRCVTTPVSTCGTNICPTGQTCSSGTCVNTGGTGGTGSGGGSNGSTNPCLASAASAVFSGGSFAADACASALTGLAFAMNYFGGQQTANYIGQWSQTYFIPGLKNMTAQLHSSRVDQTRQVASSIDAQNMTRTALLQQKQETTYKKDNHPNELTCVAGSYPGALAETSKLSTSMTQGFKQDLNKRAANAPGTAAASGPAADQKKRWDDYCSEFQDPDANNGVSVCPNPAAAGNVPNGDINVESFLLKDTINMYSSSEYKAASALLMNLTQKEAPQTISGRAIETAAGREWVLRKQHLESVRNIASDVVAAIIARRTPTTTGLVDIGAFKDLRTKAGVEASRISNNPSYNEIMLAMTKERFFDPGYFVHLQNDLGAIKQEQTSINAYTTIQMQDIYKLQEQINALLAARAALKFNTDDKPAQVQSAPVK